MTYGLRSRRVKSLGAREGMAGVRLWVAQIQPVYSCSMRETMDPATLFLSIFAAVLLSVPALHAQTTPPPPDSKTVSEVDAGLGSCTADFTITDENGGPVYAATIRVHITYGFASLHKLDMEVGTNSAGKARFIGLPDHPKQGLFFRASEGKREGSAFDDPGKTCKANFTMQLFRKD